MLLSLCENADFIKVLKLIKVIIVLLKICVPLGLIISISIGYLNAVKDNDAGALKKVNQSLIPKAIAAVAIFLIPTLVKVILRVTVANDNYSECLDVLELNDTIDYNNLTYSHNDITIGIDL